MVILYFALQELFMTLIAILNSISTSGKTMKKGKLIRVLFHYFILGNIYCRNKFF